MDGRADHWGETRAPDAVDEAVADELVLDRALQLREREVDPLLPELVGGLGEGVGRGRVDVGERLGRDDDAADRRRCRRDRTQQARRNTSTLAKKSGASRR
jgi:hypothetical protein